MATFTTLSDRDIQDVLAAYDLAGYRSHEPIAAGTINTNVRVVLGDRTLFLRINEGKPEEDVRREAAILAHVTERGVPTPLPLAARDGRRYAPFGDAFVSLFPWVPGKVLGRYDVTPAHARAVGAALAGLHAAGADFGDRRPGRYEPDEIERRFARIAALGDAALGEAVSLLEPELAALRTERLTDLPRGLIHGDLFIDNVLFESPQALSLIDFEQASWGGLAYDVAVTLLAFAYGREDFRPEHTRALIEGYASVRPPSDEERRGFGAELRFAACRFAVTRITDVHMRRGEGAPVGKSFERYLHRLGAVKRHLLANDGLLSL